MMRRQNQLERLQSKMKMRMRLQGNLDLPHSTENNNGRPSKVKPVTTHLAPRLLRLKAASSYLSMSTWKVRQLICAGELPAIQPEPGSPWLLDIRDLDHYVDISKHTY